jgi:hypothetical protein
MKIGVLDISASGTVKMLRWIIIGRKSSEIHQIGGFQKSVEVKYNGK